MIPWGYSARIDAEVRGREMVLQEVEPNLETRVITTAMITSSIAAVPINPKFQTPMP